MTNIVGCGQFTLAERANLLDASEYAMLGVALSTASATTFDPIGMRCALALTSGWLPVEGRGSPDAIPARMGPVVRGGEAVMQVP